MAEAIITRAEARKQGLKHYFTDNLCKRGHVAERRTSDLSCMECERERGATQHRKNNKRAWRLLNAEKHREYSRQWRARNPDKNRQKLREWARQNPDRVRVLNVQYKQTRRAKELQAIGSFSPEDIVTILQQQKFKCAYCRCKLGKVFERDHIVPMSRGGSNDRRNIQILCRPCNRRKCNIDPIKFAQRLGKLL